MWNHVVMEIFTKGPRTHAHDDADLVYPVITFFGIEFLVSKTYLGGKKNDVLSDAKDLGGMGKLFLWGCCGGSGLFRGGGGQLGGNKLALAVKPMVALHIVLLFLTF